MKFIKSSQKKPELLDQIIFITASPNELHLKLPNQDLRVLSKPFHYQMLEFHIADIYRQHSAEQHGP